MHGCTTENLAESLLLVAVLATLLTTEIFTTSLEGRFVPMVSKSKERFLAGAVTSVSVHTSIEMY
jgi:hypothetical protein